MIRTAERIHHYDALTSKERQVMYAPGCLLSASCFSQPSTHTGPHLQIRNRLSRSSGMEWMAAWRGVLQETCSPKCVEQHSQVQVQATTQQVLFNGFPRACEPHGGDVCPVEGVFSSKYALAVSSDQTNSEGSGFADHIPAD